MKIQELKEYHKNPRKITGERFDKLQDSLLRLGDLGGIVVNRPTKEVIGGNQRTKSFVQEKERYTIEISEELDTPRTDGTVAYGYVIRDKGTSDEQKFSYREVEWNEKQCEEANVVANKLTGFWDFDILANSFAVEDLMDYGFSKQDLDLLPRDTTVSQDKDGLSKSMDSYLEGNIKQIVLYFKNEDFDATVARLDAAMADFGLQSHTDVIVALLKEHEDSKA